MFRRHLVGAGRQNVGSVPWKLLVLLRKVKLQTRLEPRFYLAEKGPSFTGFKKYSPPVETVTDAKGKTFAP